MTAETKSIQGTPFLAEIDTIPFAKVGDEYRFGGNTGTYRVTSRRSKSTPVEDFNSGYAYLELTLESEGKPPIKLKGSVYKNEELEKNYVLGDFVTWSKGRTGVCTLKNFVKQAHQEVYTCLTRWAVVPMATEIKESTKSELVTEIETIKLIAPGNRWLGAGPGQIVTSRQLIIHNHDDQKLSIKVNMNAISKKELETPISSFLDIAPYAIKGDIVTGWYGDFKIDYKTFNRHNATGLYELSINFEDA